MAWGEYSVVECGGMALGEVCVRGRGWSDFGCGPRVKSGC